MTVRAAALATTFFPAQQRFPSLVHAPSEEDDAAVAEQPRTLLDEIGGPEVARRAAQHAITAVLAEADPELSVRPLFAPLLAMNAVDAHIGHLARSFQQLFGGGRSGRPLTEELLRSWHPNSAGRCTRRQLDAVSAHMMNGFTLACPDEEAVGCVGAYFGTYFDAIQRVFLDPRRTAPHRRGAARAATRSSVTRGSRLLTGPARSAQALDQTAVPGPSPGDERPTGHEPAQGPQQPPPSSTRARYGIPAPGRAGRPIGDRGDDQPP